MATLTTGSGDDGSGGIDEWSTSISATVSGVASGPVALPPTHPPPLLSDHDGGRAGDGLPLPRMLSRRQVAATAMPGSALQRSFSSDEVLVLASSGLEALVSPEAAGLLAHAFSAPGLEALRPAFEAAGSARAQSGRLQHGNVASVLTHQALARAVERHNARFRLRLDYTSLTVGCYLVFPSLPEQCVQ